MSTTVRTPHVEALADALDARDHTYTIVAPDVIEVRDVAPDDLGMARRHRSVSSSMQW